MSRIAREIGAGMALICFWFPAWLINFTYMSVVFVAVSTRDASTAWEYYCRMVGFG